MEKTKYLLCAFLLVILIPLTACSNIGKTGQAIGDIINAQTIVLSEQDGGLIQAASEAAGALGGIQSAFYDDPGISVTQDNLIIIGTYNSATQAFSNPFITEYLHTNDFTSNTGAIILSGSLPRTYVIIVGNSVSLTEQAINIVKEYGMDNADGVTPARYFDELNWGFTRLDLGGNIVDHCSDGVKNSDEEDIDCGGFECSACVLPPPTIYAIRSLPSAGYVGQDFEVSLFVDVDQTNLPPSMYVHEQIPSGCVVKSTNPPRTLAPSGALEWYFSDVYGYSPITEDTTLYYIINCGGLSEYSFNGGFVEAQIGNRVPIPTNSITLSPVCTNSDGDAYNACDAAGNVIPGCGDLCDCDDTLDSVYPGAVEIPCDLVDQDCNHIDLCSCVDSDGDSRFAISVNCPSGDDCNDADSTVYPGAPEICDGKDNDCNSATGIDVNPAGVPLTKTEGCVQYGICSGSEKTCSNGAWSACSIVPGTEVCDSLDNDCDNEVDDGAGCVCAIGTSRSCSQNYQGICADGTEICTDGTAWAGCPTAQDEVCDGLSDENCDGAVDESCNTISSLITSTISSPRAQKPKVVIGVVAAASDNIGAIDVSGVTGITRTIMDNTVTNPTSQNLIIVGGPCANSVAADLMGVPYAAYGCEQGFINNQGIIKVMQTTPVGPFQIIVAGHSALDTRRAARVIARHNDFDFALTARQIITRGTGAGVNDVEIG
ncbi:MAG: hypothetical protein KJ561_06370 [Nanoarchaeota archaeon]|nr:hypothetical protein [Nanoarchaeota archaeon]